MATALYDQRSWGVLTEAIREAKAGNGQSLMQLADQYAHRRPGGGYNGNLMESIYAVNCLDRPDSRDLTAYETYAKDFSVKAPTWGAALAWGALPCGVWPVKAAVGPAQGHGRGQQPHRRRRHHPRPRNDLRVVGASARPARQRCARVVRR